MAQSYRWTARANSLVFNISLTQGTPSTASSTFGQSTVTCVITAEGPYDYNYGHKFIVKLIDLNNSNATETLINWNDTNISENFPIYGGATVLNKTSTRKFVRGSNGYLNVRLTIEWAQYQTGYSGTFTTGSTTYPDFKGDYSAMYSACTAPSTISANVSIQKPSGTVTISWGAGGGGTNTTVSSYKVYYKIASKASDVPTTSDSSQSVTSGRSWTYTVPSAASNRGKYVVFKVQSISNVSGYNSGLSTVSCSVKINTVPTTPTVKIGTATATSRTISSTGSVTLTASGSTDVDDQTLSYQYRIRTGTGSWGSWTSGSSYAFTTSTLSQNVTKGIQFRASDGLETSSETSEVQITRNLAPTISSFSSQTPTTYSANGLTFAKSVELAVTTNKSSGTIKISGRVLSRTVGTGTLNATGSGWTQEINWTEFATATVTSTSVTNTRWLYSSIKALIGSYDSNKDYAIAFKMAFDDGIEETGNNAASNWYYASGHPIIKGTYNQHGSSAANISGTTAGQFYNKIRIVTYQDEYLKENGDAPTAAFSVSGTAANVTVQQKDSAHETWYDITFSRIPDPNASGTLTLTLPFSNTYSKIITTGTLTETKQATPGAITLSTSSFKMFEINSTYTCTVTMGWPFGTSTTYAAAATAYNLSTTATAAIKLVINYNNNIKFCTFTNITKTNDNLVGTINMTNLFDWSTDTFIGAFAGQKNLTVYVYIVNLFEQGVGSGIRSLILDFNTPPTITDSDIKLRGYRNSSTYYNIGEAVTISNVSRTFYLQEGIECELQLGALKRYTDENITISVYMKASNASGDGTLIKTFTLTAGTHGSGYADKSGGNYNSSSYTSGKFAELPMLTASSYTFTIKIKGAYTTLVTKAITKTAIQRTAPSLSLNSLTFSATGTANGTWSYSTTLTHGFSGTNLPTGATIAYSLVRYQNGSYTNAGTSNINTGSGSVASNISSGWSSCTIMVRAIVTITASFTSGTAAANNFLESATYTYYSNPILVYASTPTVAYREHQVGINAASEDLGNYAVTIKNSTNKQGVGFKGAYSNIGQVLIQDNSTAQTTIIKIEGFTIDCGTL